ncbi:carbohydrate ABC transporter permease [Vallitalea pronyensis]|uniref:carbohydrate ABC transporter permease n=1 Tax=Vallitalea pronyensis TaxID=1348613 RepID=UPI001FEC8F8F|nr:sugar ABC transporter permease [Vallitalea pronyensis]
MLKRKKIVPYYYILPGLLMILFFVYVPVISNFVYSFFRLSSYSSGKVFVGFDNYIKLFTSDTFFIMIKNNTLYAVISLIVQVGFGTIIALFIESKLTGRLRNVYRNIYFIPALISLTAVGLLFNFVYSPEVGLLNSALRAMGLQNLTQAWLGNSKTAIFSIIAMSQWQFTGYITLLMVVAIQNVPKDYIEAAAIDGAGPIRKAFSIMIPLVKEQLLVCSIITIIGAFKLFTEVYATTSGGPGNSSQVLGVYLYQNAFLHDKMGLAAATGVLIFVITVTISIIQIVVTKSGKV